jgi:CotS family spore coat protein
VAEDETGVRYWMKDLVEGSECSTVRAGEMLEAVEQLAQLHTQTHSLPMNIPPFMKSERMQLEQMYRRHVRELVQVKNYVHARKSRNTFEQLFWEQYPYYIEQAKQAIARLEDCALQEGDNTCLCHGDFNQHNILRTAEGMRIVHFETMCCNEPVVDLSNFVRKMLEKNHWDVELGIRLLETYDRTRPLSERERNLLYVTLLFPEKFWKVSNHYNNSHKAWVSQRDIEKLKRIMATEEERRKFLQNLLAFLQK